MEEDLFSFQSKKDFRTCVISYMFHLIEIIYQVMKKKEATNIFCLWSNEINVMY